MIVKISEKMRSAYMDFSPRDWFGYLNDAGHVSITNTEEITCIAPDDETEEKFFDRIERSKKSGRNLFFEEWEPMPEYPIDANY